jgi:cell division protein FtsW (lipid II flippase)
MPTRVRPYVTLLNAAILIAVLFLIFVGVVSMYGAEQAGAKKASGKATKQLVFAAVALTALAAATVYNYQKIGRYAYFCFGASIFLLIIVFTWPPRNGSHRWIWIPLVPFNIQPSELAKVAFILALARYLQYRANYRSFVGLLGPFLLTFVPLTLILLEPDLGTSLLLLPVLFVMLFVAGAKLSHLSAIVLCGLLAAPPLFLIVTKGSRSYQRARVISVFLQNQEAWESLETPDGPAVRKALHFANRFLGSQSIRDALEREDGRALQELIYPHGSWSYWLSHEGFQLTASKTVVGSGGLFGKGAAGEAHIRFLPDSHNDFIFAILAHQWGFAGAILVLIAYLVIVVCAIEIATMTNDPFGRLLAIGAATMISAQVFINVAMTVGLMPITGMTLPFVSYGGSSLVANSLTVGLLLNVSSRRPILLIKPPFEFKGK